MNIHTKKFNASCGLKEFKINGKNASYYDFGDLIDIDPDSADEGECGDMQFKPVKVPNLSVLNKYNITEDEYKKVCERLKVAMNHGGCGSCI